MCFSCVPLSLCLIVEKNKYCNYFTKSINHPIVLYLSTIISGDQHALERGHNEGFINNAYQYDELDHHYLYGQFDVTSNMAHQQHNLSDIEIRVVEGEEDAGPEERDNRCLPEFQFSMIDSEYDEALNIPDSVTIISAGGDKPVLVERKEYTDDDDFDEEEIELRRLTEIPFTRIYGPTVKFTSFQRKVFMPGTEILVKIIDIERSVTTHLLNPNL